MTLCAIPPDPSPADRLAFYTAQGRWRRSRSGAGRFELVGIPRRPALPPDPPARVAAARLAKPRGPRLDRPELHRGHAHPTADQFAEAIAVWARHGSPVPDPPDLAALPPLERPAAVAALHLAAAAVDRGDYFARWRLGDLDYRWRGPRDGSAGG